MFYRISFTILFFSIIVGAFQSLQAQLPADFYEERLDISFNLPVGICFDERGRGYVWEKGGRVYILDSLDNLLPAPFIDLSEEVGEWRDHGMLGFTLHPNFYENGYVYLMYTVDRHHLLYHGTPDYHPDSTITEQATIGRIVRYTADQSTNFKTVDPSSRKIILGHGIADGFPITANFHGVGDLQFGEDGTLLASCGDGGLDIDPDHPNETYHAFQALDDGIIREAEFIGPFRAQLVNNLNGKIIRIDPETGQGMPGNPWYDPAATDIPASKIFAMGFRNPYRFVLIPGTGAHSPEEADPGTLLVGDVGEGQWEELNMMDRPGNNFGWPIYEGLVESYGWAGNLRENKDESNPLFNTSGCDQEYFYFKDLIKQASERTLSFPNPCDPFQEIPAETPVFEHERPILVWSHSQWNLPLRAFYPDFDPEGDPIEVDVTAPGSSIQSEGFGGYSSIPGFWYEEGNFPDRYDNSCFIADFSGWIKVFRMNDQYELIGVDSFRNDIKGIVALGYNPTNGSIYWLNIYNGALYRISYGGNPPPIALIDADTFYGSSPLTVQFDATGSSDANGPIESYFWDFGDGDTSYAPVISHMFQYPNNEAHAFEVVLTVTDTSGATNSSTVLISVNNSPPNVKITSVNDGEYYPVSDFTNLPLTASVADAEHQGNELTYQWQTYLHHNAHFHPEPVDTNRSTYTTIDPLGCGDETYWFRIKLTVTDAAGLSGTDELEIFPFCEEFKPEVDPFVAEAGEDRIKLFWTAVNENDVDAYIIQKLGNNAHIFDLDTVEADNSITYSHLDFYPIFGINEYRLKIVRNDGVYDYSSWAKVDYPPPGSFRISPNPAQGGKITLYLSNVSTNLLTIRLFTSSGRLIRELLSPVMQDKAAEVEINTSLLLPGSYILDIQNGPEHLSRILIVH